MGLFTRANVVEVLVKKLENGQSAWWLFLGFATSCRVYYDFSRNEKNHDNRVRFEEHTSLAALEMSEKAAGADILQVEWRDGGVTSQTRR